MRRGLLPRQHDAGLFVTRVKHGGTLDPSRSRQWPPRWRFVCRVASYRHMPRSNGRTVFGDPDAAFQAARRWPGRWSARQGRPVASRGRNLRRPRSTRGRCPPRSRAPAPRSICRSTHWSTSWCRRCVFAVPGLRMVPRAAGDSPSRGHAARPAHGRLRCPVSGGRTSSAQGAETSRAEAQQAQRRWFRHWRNGGPIFQRYSHVVQLMEGQAADGNCNQAHTPQDIKSRKRDGHSAIVTHGGEGGGGAFDGHTER